MRMILLSQTFYAKYGGKAEIMDKENRPYACFTVEIDGILYAIPIRHHIRHPFAFFTVGESGLDYSKAVVIEDPSYISDQKATIDQREWNAIKAGNDTIFYEFRKFVRQYKRALAHPDNPRSEQYLKYCTLRHFNI